jgi:hypothetical protein
MTEPAQRSLRIALIWFMTGTSAAVLLIWAMIGTFYASAEGYFNLYIGFAVVLFLPSLFAGMVSALGAIAGMNFALRHTVLSQPMGAGIGAFAAYGIPAHIVLYFLGQGLFPIWITVVSALVLGLVAMGTVHRWRRTEAQQTRGAVPAATSETKEVS